MQMDQFTVNRRILLDTIGSVRNKIARSVQDAAKRLGKS